MAATVSLAVPVSSKDDVGDRRLFHLEQNRDGRLRPSEFPESSDNRDLFFAELRRSIERPSTDRLPSLRDHVVGVVFLGAKKQVIGVDTSAVVTPMEHAHSGWYLTAMHEPGDAMCHTCLTVISSGAVSAGARGSGPFDAPGRNWNGPPPELSRIPLDRRIAHGSIMHGSISGVNE